MKYDWIDSYLTEKTGVTKDIQEEWNWIRCCGSGCFLISPAFRV